MKLWSKLKSFIRRRRLEAEMAEEMRHHLEEQTAANLRAGMPPEEARYAARQQFGHLDGVKEQARDQRGWGWLENFGKDLRYAVRGLIKSPGFATVAVLTLALCMSANLVIVSVVDGVLLRPLPFPQAERLVTIYGHYPKSDLGRAATSTPDLYNRRGNIEAFASLATYKSDAVIVGEPGSGQRLDILRISSDFFATLGVFPAVGRAFTEDEMTFQTHHVAILADSYWREHFDADPDIRGRTVRINGFDKVIIGVLPPGFRFLSTSPELLLPLSSDPADRGIDHLHSGISREMIGRLRPDATLTEAQAQIDAHDAIIQPQFRWAEEVAATGFRSVVAPLHADHVAAIRPTLVLLQVGGLFLLLIGAFNLVNLLLVRNSARAKELAVRLSLGASRARVMRQMITETFTLTMIGGLAGLGIASVAVRLLVLFGVDQLPLGSHVALDGRVMLAALFGIAVVGLGTGTFVAWFNLRGHLVDALQSATRSSTTGHAAQRLRHGFVTAQIAMAFILLTGCGLLSVSLKQAMEISPGFQPEHVLSGHVSMLHKNYFEQTVRREFADRVAEEAGQLPGVQAAGIVTLAPLAGRTATAGKRVMTVPEGRASNEGLPFSPYVYGITGTYFRALGVPLQAGRYFDRSESDRGGRVCIVDETFARLNWADADPLGKQVYDGPDIETDEQPFTVVGVVGSIKQATLTEQSEHGAIYFPLRDHTLSIDDLYVVVRTTQRPEAIGPSLEKMVREIEPELPLNDLQTMETRIANSLVARRSPALLAGVFAVVALLLAAIGTYGVLAYAVAQRRREIGVRMALGAQPREISRQFLSLGLRLLTMGTLLGVFGAWLAGQAMQNILFNVPSLHPATLVGTTFILGAAALIACVLPAVRASRVDPMVVLRDE